MCAAMIESMFHEMTKQQTSFQKHDTNDNISTNEGHTYLDEIWAHISCSCQKVHGVVIPSFLETIQHYKQMGTFHLRQGGAAK